MTVTDETGRRKSGTLRFRIDPALATWIGVAVFAAACFFYRHSAAWLITYPEAYVVPLPEWLNALMQWFVNNFRWFFQGISWGLTWPITWFKDLLHWMPWPATITLFTMLALAASGWRLAVFTFLALFYMVVVGYWDASMNTLALVFMAVLLSLSIGFLLGVLAYQSRRADRIIQPALDLMQVVPTFAYLIPILLLFGFGLVVGLIATAIYSCPPMVRNVLLALRRIPKDIVESG
ncbi:MAG: ABC transporter permease subunit, partial [Deltaproteobacteria bacterium]|nr:ABC transporter permease subunit [Deltaproteobacteria bacterium]